MARTARLAVEIDGRRARTGAAGVNGELDRLKGNARGVSREFDALGRVMTGVLALFGGRELIRFADEASRVRSQLRALSGGNQELASRMADVQNIAKETRSDLSATTTLYATLTRSGEDLGLQQTQIARITETVNKSFAITGTDGNTAAGAIRQLSQAFQSGVLRGDEFNTVAEAAPVLMDALADAVGKPRSELRALAEDGRLSADLLAAAFSDPRITAGIDEQFSQIAPTVAARLTEVRNAAVIAIGTFDELTGFSSALTSSLSFVADNLSTIIPIALALGTAFAARLAVGAVTARLAIITMSAAAAGAQAPLAALGFTARAAGASVLAAFGGPIGLAVTGVALAFGFAAGKSAELQAEISGLENQVKTTDKELVDMEKFARDAGVSVEYVGTAAQSSGNWLLDVGKIVADTAFKFTTLGQEARFAAIEMARTELIEAQATAKSAREDALGAASFSAIASTGNPLAGLAGRLLYGDQEDLSTKLDLATRREAQANRKLQLLEQLPPDYFKRTPTSSLLKDEEKKVTKSRDAGSDSRTNKEIFEDFQAELRKRGIVQAAGRTGYRSAADQNDIYKKGQSPLDGYNGISRHQTYEALDPTRASHNDRLAREAAQAAGLRNFEIVKESGGRRHYEWRGAGERGEPDIEGSEQRLQELQQMADQSRQSIANIGLEFSNIPADVKTAVQSTEELNKIIAELSDKKPANFEKMIADAEALRPIIQESLKKPIEDMLKLQEEDIQLAELRRDGRHAEAGQLELQKEIMSAIGVEDEEQLAIALQKRGITADQYNQLFANLGVMQQITAEEEARNQLISARRGQVEQVRDNIEQTISELPKQGIDAFGNFFSGLQNQFNDFFAKELTANLFGGAFEELDAELSGKKKIVEADETVAKANLLLAESVTATAVKLEQLGNVAAGAANGLAGTEVANDNDYKIEDAAKEIGGEIQVLGDRWEGSLGTFGRIFTKLFETVLGKDSPLAKEFGELGAVVSQGIALGQTSSGIFGAVTGVEQSNLGASIGGAIGNAIVPGIGGLVGGLLGGTVGGFFKKQSSASSVIGFDEETNDFSTNTTGNKAAAREAVSRSADGVTSGLRRIADALGAELGAFSVSIGQHKDYFRVSASGSSDVGSKKFPRRAGSDLLYDGKDEGEAIRVAILNAIQDGAIKGLREGAARLLQATGDIEAQLEKALRFEQVFKDLREIDDPIGAAVDAVNKDFYQLIDIFKEAGASAAEYADLERLYQIRRQEAIEQANNRTLQSMQDYLFQLTAGSQSVLSPQLRYQNSLNELQTLDARRASGQTVDFDEYQTVADAFLTASRDYQGSTTSYFQDFARITSTIQDWIQTEQARTSSGVGLPTIDFSPLTNAVEFGTNVTATLLQQINATLQNLSFAANDNSGGSSGSGSSGTGSAGTNRYYQLY